MGSRAEQWPDDEFSQRRAGRRFHVLALEKTQVWLVSRAGLRLQLWARTRAVPRHKRRPAHTNSLTFLATAGTRPAFAFSSAVLLVECGTLFVSRTNLRDGST